MRRGCQRGSALCATAVESDGSWVCGRRADYRAGSCQCLRTGRQLSIGHGQHPNLGIAQGIHLSDRIPRANHAARRLRTGQRRGQHILNNKAALLVPAVRQSLRNAPRTDDIQARLVLGFW